MYKKYIYLATRVSNDPFVGFFLIKRNVFNAGVEYNLKSSIVSFSNSKFSVIALLSYLLQHKQINLPLLFGLFT